MKAFVSLLLPVAMLLLAGEAGAQSGEDPPAWLLLERGHLQFEEGAFSDALRSYQDALAEAGVMPEAELGIARVYNAQGDPLLAVRFYEQALDQEDQFDPPGLSHQARLELAELYRIAQPSRYEEVLLEIVAEDTIFSDPDQESTKTQMRELLFEDGLDRLLVLYRLEEPFSTDAHLRLAEHYLRGRRDAAFDHALFGVVKIYSEAIAAYRERNFDYEFDSVPRFHEVIRRDRVIRTYLRESGVYKALYDLALAAELYRPRSGASQAVMESLASLEDGGSWSQRARRFLAP
ncbi:MAG: tetratricopeptide repeat protein [Alkalispirochaetaceae bacterium]